MEALEADEAFMRARRTEIGASLTAVPFYLKLGYAFKDGVTDADESGTVRMETYAGKAASPAKEWARTPCAGDVPDE